MKEFILSYITDIGITDILDIALVAFMLYKIIGFINESRAEQLIKGLLLLVLLTIISDLAKLHTVYWILREGMAVGIVALVVVFQPELRRALEYMGRSKLIKNKFNYVREENAMDMVREFVSAIDDFSKTKTGALIIIERETALTDICETGTKINADISSEIIGNIFYEGAPLHDGAIIVRGEKIHSAGCVLPLTKNPTLSKSLGTRHRAGIGITEHSDCLTIIVSEETGLISICQDGKLERFKDTKEVRKRLIDLYCNEETNATILENFKSVVGQGKKED